jgi:hypothetical protein
MEAQTCWWRRQWKAYKEKVRALQKARQQVQTRDLVAARKATEVAELKSERAQKAFLRAVHSRSAERERRDDHCTSLAADVRDLQEEVVALRAKSEWLDSQVRALQHSQGGGLVELEGRVYSMQETLPSMRKGLRLRLRDVLVQFYVNLRGREVGRRAWREAVLHRGEVRRLARARCAAATCVCRCVGVSVCLCVCVSAVCVSGVRQR